MLCRHPEHCSIHHENAEKNNRTFVILLLRIIAEGHVKQLSKIVKSMQKETPTHVLTSNRGPVRKNRIVAKRMEDVARQQPVNN